MYSICSTVSPAASILSSRAVKPKSLSEINFYTDPVTLDFACPEWRLPNHLPEVLQRVCPPEQHALEYSTRYPVVSRIFCTNVSPVQDKV